MIGGPVRPMVADGINTPRAVWSIAEIEYYGLLGERLKRRKKKKKACNNEPKNGQRDRRILAREVSLSLIDSPRIDAPVCQGHENR